ncbi:MAG: hypothetical protein E7099_08850 [Mediterranea massiliensis]|nr:hypothetical protein [Mediterranea massiliensis]
MKRFYFFLLATLLMLPAIAQEGLCINSFFGKHYIEWKKTTEVQVKGKELKPYNLTLFRSITLKDSPEEALRMEECVLKDAEKSVDKEEGRIGEHLYYGFYCLPPRYELLYRYIFYRNTSVKSDARRDEVTLVYMEGYATLEELKQMFK